jgi:hypothetical protein
VYIPGLSLGAKRNGLDSSNSPSFPFSTLLRAPDAIATEVSDLARVNDALPLLFNRVPSRRCDAGENGRRHQPVAAELEVEIFSEAKLPGAGSERERAPAWDAFWMVNAEGNAVAERNCEAERIVAVITHQQTLKASNAQEQAARTQKAANEDEDDERRRRR